MGIGPFASRGVTRIMRLNLPVDEGTIRGLRVGDVIYVSGTLITMRDAGHKRLIEMLRRGVRPPVDLNGMAIFHAGPVVTRDGDGWKVVAIGPTTSWRMEPYEADVIAKTGVRIIIGKGMMGSRTAEACKRYGAVYAIYPGGAAALAVEKVKRVKAVMWLDLGIPEALWLLEVKDFGPLMIAIDSTGRNFYGERMKEIDEKLRAVEDTIDRLSVV